MSAGSRPSTRRSRGSPARPSGRARADFEAVPAWPASATSRSAPAAASPSRIRRSQSARRSRPARAATRQRREEKLENRIRRAGGAFVHSTRELSASAYGFPVELQPSRAPCSTHDDYLTPTALLHCEGAAAGLLPHRTTWPVCQARSVVEAPRHARGRLPSRSRRSRCSGCTSSSSSNSRPRGRLHGEPDRGLGHIAGPPLRLDAYRAVAASFPNPRP